MDLGISIEEIRQALVGIIAQCLIELDYSEERKALFEILSDYYLFEALVATMKGEDYKLPEHETLTYQMARLGVKQHHAATTS